MLDENFPSRENFTTANHCTRTQSGNLKHNSFIVKEVSSTWKSGNRYMYIYIYKRNVYVYSNGTGTPPSLTMIIGNWADLGGVGVFELRVTTQLPVAGHSQISLVFDYPLAEYREMGGDSTVLESVNRKYEVGKRLRRPGSRTLDSRADHEEGPTNTRKREMQTTMRWNRKPRKSSE